MILGTHAFAEEVADLVHQAGEHELVGFVENWDRERCEEPFLGLPVTWIGDAAPLAGRSAAVCAIGTTRRHEFVEEAAAEGFSFARIRHPTTVVAPSASVGEGSILGPARWSAPPPTSAPT